MNPLVLLSQLTEYATKFGPDIVSAVSSVVDSFIEENPELADPPREAAQADIDARIDRRIKERFGSPMLPPDVPKLDD